MPDVVVKMSNRDSRRRNIRGSECRLLRCPVGTSVDVGLCGDVIGTFEIPMADVVAESDFESAILISL